MMIAQGHQEGSFISIYSENRQLGIDNAIESSSVAQAICTFVDKYSGSSPLVYYDTVQELLIQLTPYRNKNDDWPKCSKALGIALKRQITALKTVGIDVVPTEKVERINNNRGFTCKIFKSHNYATINVKPTKTVEFDHDDKERF